MVVIAVKRKRKKAPVTRKLEGPITEKTEFQYWMVLRHIPVDKPAEWDRRANVDYEASMLDDGLDPENFKNGLFYWLFGRDPALG